MPGQLELRLNCLAVCSCAWTVSSETFVVFRQINYTLAIYTNPQCFWNASNSVSAENLCNFHLKVSGCNANWQCDTVALQTVEDWTGIILKWLQIVPESHGQGSRLFGIHKIKNKFKFQIELWLTFSSLMASIFDAEEAVVCNANFAL